MKTIKIFNFEFSTHFENILDEHFNCYKLKKITQIKFKNKTILKKIK
jgi:hypothetical protein